MSQAAYILAAQLLPGAVAARLRHVGPGRAAQAIDVSPSMGRNVGAFRTSTRVDDGGLPGDCVGGRYWIESPVRTYVGVGLL